MTFLIQTLDQETAESVQAAICIGISKLLLKGDATNASVCLVFVSKVFCPDND